jgi:hypothetical protein
MHKSLHAARSMYCVRLKIIILYIGTVTLEHLASNYEPLKTHADGLVHSTAVTGVYMMAGGRVVVYPLRHSDRRQPVRAAAVDVIRRRSSRRDV